MKWYLYFLKKRNILKYAKKIGVKIGINTSISNTVEFDSEPYLIDIGNNCKITYNVRFVTHDGGLHVVRNLLNNDIEKFGRIIIGNNVFIGNNATIMPNVKIGNNVVIGYGSIVTKNIPDNEVWAGVPAKRICSIDEYIQKNSTYFKKTKKLSKKDKKIFLIDNMLK